MGWPWKGRGDIKGVRIHRHGNRDRNLICDGHITYAYGDKVPHYINMWVLEYLFLLV